MVRSFSKIVIGFFLILSGVVAYYVVDIQQARKNTPLILKQAGKTYGQTLALSDLSTERKEILLAIEDPKFFLHKGVDFETPGSGWTTITQGLVKLLYFPDGFQPGVQKIRQTLLAQYVLDDMVSKQQQLELYLNVTYMGHQKGVAVHGFSNAAEVYLGKAFRQLNDDEFLTLLAMTIGPNAMKPTTSSNQDRVVRMKEFLSGRYQPKGVFDVDYKGTVLRGAKAKALLILLKFVTDATPSQSS